MSCPICGRDPDGVGCRHCHFVHDHITDLDGTRVHDNQVQFFSEPWRIRPSLKVELERAWSVYPSDPHNA